jgi:hypothetical protein
MSITVLNSVAVDETTLGRLRWAAEQKRAWAAQEDALIERAIAEKFSERIIGQAAGMSGPAISYRKKRLKERDAD